MDDRVCCLSASRLRYTLRAMSTIIVNMPFTKNDSTGTSRTPILNSTYSFALSTMRSDTPASASIHPPMETSDMVMSTRVARRLASIKMLI